MARPHALWSYTIAGWSGFYVMVVELLSGRLIAPSFGSSIYVWGSVIFVFMLGLAIGYLLGGIYSQYRPSVVRLCGLLVAGALTTLPTVFFGTQILDFMFYAITDPRFGSLTTCMALFLVPTIFVGMICFIILLAVAFQVLATRIGAKLKARDDRRDREGKL